MIISASRRCDIPAFAGDWFLEMLRAGEARVENPFRRGPARRVSLRREDVDALVFWTRDPRPFLRRLAAIDRVGFPYCFLVTLTGYPRGLEPAAPTAAEAVAFFRELAGRIGRRRVAWRYDPVVFTPATDFAFHERNFTELAGALAPHASRVIVSFFDPYPKALRRLRRAGIDGAVASGTAEQQAGLIERFAAGAAREGLEIQSCAEAGRWAGVPPGKCIDDRMLGELFGLQLAYRKDPSQRRECLCQQSVDIGRYGTCRHGCLYCYAS